jgi:hypothetical protein
MSMSIWAYFTIINIDFFDKKIGFFRKIAMRIKIAFIKKRDILVTGEKQVETLEA